MSYRIFIFQHRRPSNLLSHLAMFIVPTFSSLNQCLDPVQVWLLSVTFYQKTILARVLSELNPMNTLHFNLLWCISSIRLLILLCLLTYAHLPASMAHTSHIFHSFCSSFSVFFIDASSVCF